jgi:hypothetical protein
MNGSLSSARSTTSTDRARESIAGLTSCSGSTRKNELCLFSETDKKKRLLGGSGSRSRYALTRGGLEQTSGDTTATTGYSRTLPRSPISWRLFRPYLKAACDTWRSRRYLFVEESQRRASLSRIHKSAAANALPNATQYARAGRARGWLAITQAVRPTRIGSHGDSVEPTISFQADAYFGPVE